MGVLIEFKVGEKILLNTKNIKIIRRLKILSKKYIKPFKVLK